MPIMHMFAGLIASTWPIATCGLAMLCCLVHTVVPGGCCRKCKWERYSIKRWWRGSFDPVPKNCTSLQVTPQHKAALPQCHEIALSYKHMPKLPFFLSLSLAKTKLESLAFSLSYLRSILFCSHSW